ncbi:MAG: AAA family ATPase [Firmicutes bacterium]|nr:AAA family ATPase [Bacillota bacterium]
MRYIVELELENFQCHAHTRLTFSPGLNVIVGPSDQGKTALLRALRWVLYNEPRGSDFVRVGADTCRVTVTFNDGTRITREKGPRTNRYVLEKDGKRDESQGVGGSVPPQVQAAHGMAPLKLDADTEIPLHLGGQLEGPFLLEAPGTLRAKAIGQVIGAHIIDAAIRDVLADEDRAARDERVLEREIAAREKDLEAFADLPERERAMERVEELLDRVEEARRRADQLVDLKQRLARNRGEAARLEQVRARLAGLEEAERALAEAEGRVQRYVRVRQVAARWQDNTARRGQWERVAAGLAGLSRAEKFWEEAAEQALRWQKLQEVRVRLTRKEEQLTAATRERERARQQVEDLRTRYGRLLLELGRCPTCGAAITPAQIPAILADVFGDEGGR